MYVCVCMYERVGFDDAVVLLWCTCFVEPADGIFGFRIGTLDLDWFGLDWIGTILTSS